jgi:poly-gamma-glutamate capsule biosynthesis protein CapA/YwtB (metallophosphatase superfamily)
MANTVRITAVGDLLMWAPQIQSARSSEGYSFDYMFQHVAPYFHRSDLMIGNLETTLSGRESTYVKRSPRTGFPMFNCPDELAATLKRVGFDVLTTANNHCMDRGSKGLARTISVLNQHGLGYTGTYRSSNEKGSYLIRTIKGIRIAILSYTYGTNHIPVPKTWMVGRIQREQILRDLKVVQEQAEYVIVAMHFGKEFRRYPSEEQKQWVNWLWDNGADLVLGCHPHVLQPMERQGNKLAVYSGGNFISDLMWKNPHTLESIILQVDIEKQANGQIRLNKVSYVPTWVHRYKTKGIRRFRVLPLSKFLRTPDSLLSPQDLATMKQAWKNIAGHMRIGYAI